MGVTSPLGAVAGRVPDAAIAAFTFEPKKMMRLPDLPVANTGEGAAADHRRHQDGTFGLDMLR